MINNYLTTYRLGAIFYILWAVFLLYVSYETYNMGVKFNIGFIKPHIIRDSLFLLAAALITAYVAIRYNWNNDRTGYWVNLLLVSLINIIILILFVIPGHVSVVGHGTGILFWVLAIIFSTIGQFNSNKKQNVFDILKNKFSR